MTVNKRLIISIFMIVLIIGFSYISNAQPGPPDPSPCDPLDPLCPIDGGLSFLLAAGIGLGAKKIVNQRKK